MQLQLIDYIYTTHSLKPYFLDRLDQAARFWWNHGLGTRSR